MGNQNANTSRLNWKASLTCYKCSYKGYLARQYPHKGTINVSQAQQAQPFINTLGHQENVALLPATDPTLCHTVTPETPILFEVWQLLMKQLIDANQNK